MNGIKLNLDDVKHIEMEILDFIDKVCKEEGIAFFLDCGTLLGAVRHKGFIPWDDDIDLLILRKDYYRLLEAINSRNTKYRVFSMYDNYDYFYAFAKIIDTTTILIENGLPAIDGLGVYVDIFPADYLPDSKIPRFFFQRTIFLYRVVADLALTDKVGGDKNGFLKRIAIKICKKYGWKRALLKIEKKCRRAAGKKTNTLANMLATSDPSRFALAEWFKDPVYLQFESGMYPVPSSYDEYLTVLYGDYMKLPPENKRSSNHSFVAFQV